MSQAQLRTLAGEPGYMDPAAMKQLLHKVWLTEYRINDLLTEVHPERWKLSDAAHTSFGKTLETLRTQMDTLEQWRAQFEKRPDSMYLGYETYAAINTLLPRLEGIGRDISRTRTPASACSSARRATSFSTSSRRSSRSFPSSCGIRISFSPRRRIIWRAARMS